MVHKTRQSNNTGTHQCEVKIDDFSGKCYCLLPELAETNQHSCHNQNNHCDLVLQYMCHDNVRDGTTTQTIPVNRAQCEGNDCSTERRYRMHEDYNYYMHCSMRSRNKGLFTADQDMRRRNTARSTRQNPKGTRRGYECPEERDYYPYWHPTPWVDMRRRNTARSTRQNPQGTRRGYECPEERDYYPYWHPTPWVDIAVLTNNVKRCHYYQQESQNVNPRWACVFPSAVMERARGKILLPINKEECEKYELPKTVSLDGIGGSRKPEWRQFPSHNVPPPECRETEWTRDNHLGNTIGGHPPMFNWTIPKHIQHENCVIRIRYNISTSDYAPWDTDSSHSAHPRKLGAGSKINLAEKFNFPSEENAKARGFIVKNNPVVKLFDGVDLDLRLAINTAQFGRVFQDRSHTFAVRPVPEDLKIQESATIHNLNVRGKRGNIVQVYPAVEYDFVPNILEMAIGDFVHTQYNISTSDYAPWDTDSSHSAHPRKLGAGSKINLAEKFNFPSEENAKARGFIVKNNSVVKLFDGVDLDLRLAINTAQFGRVFQDRTLDRLKEAVHRKRPWLLRRGAVLQPDNATPHSANLTQQWLQCYVWEILPHPAHSPDLAPSDFHLFGPLKRHLGGMAFETEDDLISELRNWFDNLDVDFFRVYPEGNGETSYPGGKFGHFGVNYPMRVANSTFLGLSKEDAITLAYSGPGQLRREIFELDNAATYFNLPPRKVTQQGTYHYMSTRNNNFSNRDQKGQVIVSTNQNVMKAIGWLGGNVTLGDGLARLKVNEGTFDDLKKVRLEKWSTTGGEKAMKAAGRYLDEGDGYVSDFYVVTPEDLVAADQPDKTFTFEMQISNSDDVEVYHATLDFSGWSRTDADIRGGMARVQAQRGGIFIARSHSKVAMM
ncbi:protein dd3-3-like [Plakobranchus ocellatus]|uniref:Protein dd3-3-like n=1 Tax=Plakobranchus ocellatus TaxID=259542 RepID=A0AAV4BUA3_9GAST|nr:protein dd3-3-like [Plakobranchus ocellatus]